MFFHTEIGLVSDKKNLSEKQRFYHVFVFTHISILPFLLTLAPFVNLTVDTFPDKRGRLTVCMLFFIY